MTTEPTKLTVSVNDRDSVTALLYLAQKKQRAGITLILGHGAGAGQLHPFMRLFANGLAARGLDVMTFNFVYMEQGRHVPDPKAKLEACYRTVMAAAQTHKALKGNRLAIGGKSMGGRIASQVAAESTGLTGFTKSDQGKTPSKKRPQATNKEKGNEIDLAGLVFLGYPLHPPGNPEKLRDAHLNQIKAPMLFIQGSRDAFGTEDELRAVIKRLHLPATLHPIAGGDHSLKVPKSAGIPQDQVYESTMDEIARWLRSEGDE
ncbi:MAG: alpha/beta family hydrolase [Acidobacteriota bacterium]